MILQNWWYTTLLHTKAGFCDPLREDIESDALVIGGGMAGLHAALRLAKAGRLVVLLERNICGGSSTGKSAGFLTPDSELELSQLARRFGLEPARRVWSMGSGGVNLIVETVREHKIECDFLEQDSLFIGLSQHGKKVVHEEAQSRQALGFPSTVYDENNLPATNTGKGYTAAIRYTGTFGINPLLYAQELKAILIQLGVNVYESTEVESLNAHIAKTHLGSVKAKNIILAVDKMPKGFAPIASGVYNAQTFMSVTEPLEEKDMRAILPDGNLMCWDSRLVYSYYRFTGDHRLILGGGSAPTTFLPMDVTEPWIIRSVIKDFKKRFPALKHVSFIQYWPGRIDTTKDLLPIVDTDDKHPSIQYVGGCVGLPWAAFCGDLAARRVLDPSSDADLSQYLSMKRDFLVPEWLQKITGKMFSFAINNAYSKYVQRGY